MNKQQQNLEFKNLLNTNNLRATPARLALLDLFEHDQKPQSVQDLAKKMENTGVDQVTLYRNVEALEKIGIIKKVRLDDRKAYYELASAKHHHHLICTNCGKLEDVHVEEENLNKAVLKNHGFAEITDHSLEFFGICNSCGKK